MDLTKKLVIDKVNQFISDFKILKDQIDDVKSWDSLPKIIENISKLRNFITNIVVTVELAVNIVKEGVDDYQKIPSEEKLNIAVKILDDAIKLPFWLELFDEHILKILISLSVDYLNDRLGKDWEIKWIKEALNNGTDFEKYFKDKFQIINIMS